MSLIRFGRASDQTFGPIEFFREAHKILSRRTTPTWADWDEFFKLAEDRVLYYAPGPTAAPVYRYPVLARALLATWRSARNARENRLTPWQWSKSEENRIMHLVEAQLRQQQEIIDGRLRSQAAAGKKSGRSAAL